MRICATPSCGGFRYAVTFSSKGGLHFTDDDIEYFQNKIDQMGEVWLIPGVISFQKEVEADNPPSTFTSGRRVLRLLSGVPAKQGRTFTGD